MVLHRPIECTLITRTRKADSRKFFRVSGLSFLLILWPDVIVLQTPFLTGSDTLDNPSRSEVVEITVGGRGGIEALSAEHPDVVKGVLRPEGHATAPGRRVVGIRYVVIVRIIGCLIRAVLVDVAGAFPPYPLADSRHVFPNIVQDPVLCASVEPYPQPPNSHRFPVLSDQPTPLHREPGRFPEAAVSCVP